MYNLYCFSILQTTSCVDFIQLWLFPPLDSGEDGTEVEQEVSCGADVATGTPGGSEEMKEMGNDEKTSEYRDVSTEQKVWMKGELDFMGDGRNMCGRVLIIQPDSD